MPWWNSWSQGFWAKERLKSLLWTLEAWTFSYFRKWNNGMGHSGKLHLGKREQNRTVRSLRTFFLEPEISPFPPLSIQAGKAGDQHSSVKTSWTKWNTRRKSTGHGIKDRHPGKKREVLSGCGGPGLEKLRYSWSWIWQGIQRIVKMASIGTLVRNGRLKKIYTHNPLLCSVPQSGTELITIDMEKVEVCSNFVCLSFH